MKVVIIGTDLNRQSDLKTQGQYLRDLLVLDGWDATIASPFRNLFLRVADTVTQILNLRKDDVIIVQVYSTLGIYLEGLAVLLGWIKRLNVISTFHGGSIPEMYRTNRMKRFILNKIIQHSTHVTVPSRFISHNIPALRSKSMLVRNYIQLEEYENVPKPQDMIRIFWMRSYHPTYDPIKAVKILEYIRSQNIPAELVMAGKDFGSLKQVSTYIKSSPYKNNISVFTVIDTETKNKMASRSNVYLCTNKIDNAPVSFVEMMAMGLPIVTTNVGGIPYYVEDEKQALISKDNSVEDLAGLIIRLHRNDTLRKSIVANGLQFCKDFSSEAVLKQWKHLLNSLHP